jgi:hypothetical protein
VIHQWQGVTDTSKLEVWKELEEQRFYRLKHAAVNLQSDMLLTQGRCPKCTLPPPCKHYTSLGDMVHDITPFFQKPIFKEHLSPRKRDFLIKSIRDTQHMMPRNDQ